MHSFVVTGASRGIGLEFCVQLLDRGNTVIALARDPDASKGLQAITNKNLHVIKADLTDIASLEVSGHLSQNSLKMALIILYPLYR